MVPNLSAQNTLAQPVKKLDFGRCEIGSRSWPEHGARDRLRLLPLAALPERRGRI